MWSLSAVIINAESSFSQELRLLGVSETNMFLLFHAALQSVIGSELTGWYGTLTAQSKKQNCFLI